MEAERILCFNVLLDESRRDVGVFRHPLYAYTEDLAWPPKDWEEICCWHCCHKCSEEPVPLPQTCDRKTGRFSVFGVFCSWSCAKQYQNEHQSWNTGERALLLEDMAREAFGYKGPPIRAAPARHRLKMFGGDLSIEHFRIENAYSNATLSPPLLSFPEVYERIASSGCEGDTAPPQWSVRGLRPAGKQSRIPPVPEEGSVAPPAAAATAPYDKYMSARREADDSNGAAPMTATTSSAPELLHQAPVVAAPPLKGSKRTSQGQALAPAAPSGGAAGTPMTLERFLVDKEQSRQSRAR